ncbi:MAG: hypothetical protein P4L16_02230 [Chlamydiales bacterium]|nr:hypothetical protein [Chlamydiales bacterium]
MNKSPRSEKPYNIIAGLIFLFGVGIFAYMGVYDWLPALCIATGIAVIVRQLALGYHIDVLVALVIFGAAFLSSFLQFFSRVFLPTFLMIGAIYYILRQFISFHDKLVVKTTDVHIEPSETEGEPKL